MWNITPALFLPQQLMHLIPWHFIIMLRYNNHNLSHKIRNKSGNLKVVANFKWGLNKSENWLLLSIYLRAPYRTNFVQVLGYLQLPHGNFALRFKKCFFVSRGKELLMWMKIDLQPPRLLLKTRYNSRFLLTEHQWILKNSFYIH